MPIAPIPTDCKSDCIKEVAILLNCTYFLAIYTINTATQYYYYILVRVQHTSTYARKLFCCWNSSREEVAKSRLYFSNRMIVVSAVLLRTNSTNSQKQMEPPGAPPQKSKTSTSHESHTPRFHVVNVGALYVPSDEFRARVCCCTAVVPVGNNCCTPDPSTYSSSTMCQSVNL